MTPEEFTRFYGILPYGMLLVALNGRILAANKAAAEVLHRPIADLQGMELAGMAADPPEKVSRLLSLVARSGEFVPGSLGIQVGSATVVQCRVDGRRLSSSGGPTLLLRIRVREETISPFRTLDRQVARLNREISDRQRAQHQLRGEREWLKIILASIGDGVIATDASATVSFMNPVAEKLTGWPRQEVIGKHLEQVFRIVDETTREPLENPVDTVRHKGALSRTDRSAVLVARDGSEFAIADSAAPIHDANGVMLGLVLVFRDVSRLRRDEQRVREINEALRRSNESLRKFAYVVAHDLKEPMRMVSLYAQLLGKKYSGQLDETGNMFIRQAVNGAVRMAELLDGLLLFMTAGDLIPEHLETVDLNEVVAKAVMNLQAAIQETGAEVTWNGLPTVQGHAKPLVNLFQNFISNGVKYHRQGDAPKVRIGAERAGKEWLITIEDNGIGIESQYFETIFGVFKRLHPEKYLGTGIGLALCRQIVEARGGVISVESEPGKGSRFLVTFPDLSPSPA